jgi:hypothetical protein
VTTLPSTSTVNSASISEFDSRIRGFGGLTNVLNMRSFYHDPNEETRRTLQGGRVWCRHANPGPKTIEDASSRVLAVLAEAVQRHRSRVVSDADHERTRHTITGWRVVCERLFSPTDGVAVGRRELLA